MRTEVQPAKAALNVGSVVQVFALALVIAALSEWLGPLPIALGVGKVVLLPMIWALLIGLVLGLLRKRMPGAATEPVQPESGRCRAVLRAVSVHCQAGSAGRWLAAQAGGSRLGAGVAGVGQSGRLRALGMPVALLLGIKREAIGATFSIGREPGLAIIGERFGMDSPEGRGVLAEYITGTLIGAIFISLLAGFVSSLNIFHRWPWAWAPVSARAA
jgi:hypothetical protein